MSTVPYKSGPTVEGGPFSWAVWHYRERGWRGTLPVSIGDKKPAVAGRTGYDGIDPTDDDIHGLLAGQFGGPGYGIGIRMPDDVIGVDVDVYGDKTGHDTLDLIATEKNLCELPPTYSSTARGPGQPSRILWYRVQEDNGAVGKRRRWKSRPGGATGGVELISYKDRIAVVWPSVHPATGTRYEWYAPDMATRCGPPWREQLAVIPNDWRDELSLGRSGGLLSETNGRVGADLSVSAASAWGEALAHGSDVDKKMCLEMSGLWQLWCERLGVVGASRHDTMRDAVWSVVMAGVEGHQGVGEALYWLGECFLDLVVGDRGGDGSRRLEVAEAEWGRVVLGAVDKAAVGCPDPGLVVACRCMDGAKAVSWGRRLGVVWKEQNVRSAVETRVLMTLDDGNVVEVKKLGRATVVTPSQTNKGTQV
jgi:hypothetical protein